MKVAKAAASAFFTPPRGTKHRSQQGPPLGGLFLLKSPCHGMCNAPPLNKWGGNWAAK